MSAIDALLTYADGDRCGDYGDNVCVRRGVLTAAATEWEALTIAARDYREADAAVTSVLPQGTDMDAVMAYMRALSIAHDRRADALARLLALLPTEGR